MRSCPFRTLPSVSFVKSNLLNSNPHNNSANLTCSLFHIIFCFSLVFTISLLSSKFITFGGLIKLPPKCRITFCLIPNLFHSHQCSRVFCVNEVTQLQTQTSSIERTFRSHSNVLSISIIKLTIKSTQSPDCTGLSPLPIFTKFDTISFPNVNWLITPNAKHQGLPLNVMMPLQASTDVQSPKSQRSSTLVQTKLLSFLRIVSSIAREGVRMIVLYRLQIARTRTINENMFRSSFSSAINSFVQNITPIKP